MSVNNKFEIASKDAGVPSFKSFVSMTPLKKPMDDLSR
jgi:hypothetical protein